VNAIALVDTVGYMLRIGSGLVETLGVGFKLFIQLDYLRLMRIALPECINEFL
jgi:hypothetical protein